jgi:hypothetical protein
MGGFLGMGEKKCWMGEKKRVNHPQVGYTLLNGFNYINILHS